MKERLLERLIQLVDAALASLADPKQRLSAAIQQAIRIARLRGDWENLWWLEVELRSLEAPDRDRLMAETSPHLTREQLAHISDKTFNAWKDDRATVALQNGDKIRKGEKGVMGLSVFELEQAIANIDRSLAHLTVPTGLHPVDLYFENEKILKLRLTVSQPRQQFEAVLDRIRVRVHAFLSATEKQLFMGEVSADIFERNRRYVDQRLVLVAPEVAEQFAAAYKRLETEDGVEARSHALTSCRRALKSLADRLYPASEKPVTCPDGKDRILSDDKFINRLWQYLHQNVATGAARQMTLATLHDFGNRLDKAHDFVCKGVHANVSEAEANLCVIQTYLLIGEILRLADEPTTA